MKQEQLEKEGIKVGGYYVVRRGKRIAVMNPGYTDTLGKWNESTYSYETVDYDPELQITFTEKQAEHLFGSLDRLNLKQKEQDGLQDKIYALEDEIAKLENEIANLEDRKDEEIKEDFRDYEITLSGDGIQFGCTEVSKANLKAIGKLLKKGKK